MADSSVKKLDLEFPDVDIRELNERLKAEASELKQKNSPNFESRLLLKKISRPEHLRFIYEDGHETKKTVEAADE